MKVTKCKDCGIIIEVEPSKTKREYVGYSLCKSCLRVRRGGKSFNLRDLGVL
jgi:hypothetical protein